MKEIQKKKCTSNFLKHFIPETIIAQLFVGNVCEKTGNGEKSRNFK